MAITMGRLCSHLWAIDVPNSSGGVEPSSPYLIAAVNGGHEKAIVQRTLK